MDNNSKILISDESKVKRSISEVKNKLLNFPSVYYTTLQESIERQNNIKSTFFKFGIENYYELISKRLSESNDKISGKYLSYIDNGTIGCCTSHLKMIKKWYYETDEPYAFFCEDDLSFETVQYWNFTWDEFVKELPENWDVIQLICISEHLEPIKFRKRYWNDWSVGAYLLSRKHAKVLIDSFTKEDEFVLEYPEDYYWGALVEHLVYYTPRSAMDQPEENIIYNVYTFPLFVEDINFSSTFNEYGDHKEHHLQSNKIALEWWKTVGKNLSIKDIIQK